MTLAAPTPPPTLTETVAVRLTLDECRALADIARLADRTLSYIIRAELRKFLRERQHAA